MTLATVPAYDSGRSTGVGDHAVVVGASVSGLLAARALADGFERVTVVDRDTLPGGPTPRDGAPQARQPHALQEAGRAIIEDLFPGYGEDVVSAGGVEIDAATDFNFYDEGGYVADSPTAMPMYVASRPLLEHVLRRRVAGLDGVTVRDDCRVVDYRTDGAGGTVTGVDVREGDDDESLSADLTVDATGRASRAATWLSDNGYEAPDVAEVTVDLAYSTAIVERDPDERQAFWAPASAPHTRGGGALPIEGDRWQVVVHGVHGDDPPRDPEAFREFASTLRISVLERILDDHAMLSEDVDYYPFPSNRRHYYEALDRFPDGLVVVGDAVASYNPIYGQGMSVAALHALVLHHALAEGGLEDVGRRFFREVEPVVDIAWTMAVGADFQFDRTTGPKPLGTGLMGWYLSRLTRKAHTDGELAERFFRVVMMERPPASLVRPGVLWRVLRPDV
jgi:2-polyprenyl-6-methoxyphenol hydroxylase-like FAD-dependent oxidoreductase